MTATRTARTRRRATALLAIALAVVLTGCSVPVAGRRAMESASSSATPVLLRFDGGVATASLADTPEARQLTAMLPVTVELKDVWGQAMSGRLPHPLTVEGSAPVHEPVPGDIYLRPLSDVIAVYYDDLGQAVPDPGLVRLGAVDTGLDSLAGAGRRVTVQIDLA